MSKSLGPRKTEQQEGGSCISKREGQVLPTRLRSVLPTKGWLSSTFSVSFYREREIPVKDFNVSCEDGHKVNGLK